MTRRERVLMAARHEEPDRVPYQIDLTAQAHARLVEHVGDPGYMDGIGNHLAYGVYDLFMDETAPGSGYFRDDFGVIWNRTDPLNDSGVVEGLVLPEASLEGFALPALDEARLRRQFEAGLAEAGDRCRVAEVGWGIFERAWALRGMENLLADMAAEPAFVEELFARIAGHLARVVEIALEYPFDIIYFGDDWGSQRGLILGPHHWRRYLKPHMRDLFGSVKARGRATALHSCGDIRALLPELAEIGLDIYQTFQPEVYDLGQTKHELGQTLAFWGGISTQQLLPYGTPAEVRAEVRRTLEIMGPGGGYIAGPTHAVPGDVPPENLVALAEALLEQ